MSSQPLALVSLCLALVACDPGSSGGGVIVPPCQNGRQDVGETGVDCGGTCGVCAGASCTAPAECASKNCVAEVCAAPTCDDGIKNGTELQVDCGGTCGACQQPSCTNGIKDGNETGVDCGGSCPACTTGDTCDNGVKDADEEDVDCGGPCTPCGTAPSCDDGFDNGDETDTDCGGSCPTKCDVGEGCLGGGDCVTSVCSDNVCGQAAASCTNNTADGDETDKDCGGSCPGCATGLLCDDNDDCLSATCIFGVCRDPSCTDNIQNQGESDVDCGGTRCGKCEDGKECGRASDCQSGQCDGGGRCVSCEDGLENQDETDVDCGGGCPDKCANERGCDGPDDCVSGLCISGTCKPEGSSAGVCDIEADCSEGFYCEYTWNDEGGAAADWEHVCLAEREGADIGASCQVLEDCAGFGCFYGFCSAACSDDDDCAGSAVCASTENYFDSDGDDEIDVLLSLEYCHAFQSPAGACMSHTDCGAGKRCTIYLDENLSGAQLDPDGPYKAVGRCEAEIAGGAAEGAACETDLDCKSGVCGRQGICTRYCEATSECSPVNVSGAGTLQRVCAGYVAWGGGDLEDETGYVWKSDCVALNGAHSLTPCGPGTATPLQCGAGEACQANFIAAGPDIKAKAEWLCFESEGAVAAGGPCADGSGCQSGYCFSNPNSATKYCSRPCTVGSDTCSDAVEGPLSCTLEPVIERKGKYLNNGLSIGFCMAD